MTEFSLVNKHSWLVSNWGPCLSGLIWPQQIAFMAAPRPSIRPATEDLVDSSRGHVVATETAFESSHINDTGCWHETKRKRKAGKREGRTKSVSVVLSLDRTGLQFGWDATELSQPLTLQCNTMTVTLIHGCASRSRIRIGSIGRVGVYIQGI